MEAWGNLNLKEQKVDFYLDMYGTYVTITCHLQSVI